MGNVALERGPNHHRACRFVEGANREQSAAHVGMNDNRISRLVRRLWPRESAALQPVAGIGHGVLVGDFRLRQPLHRDTKPRLVHHHEHALHALVFLADQPPGGAVIVHHAGGIAVNAHLVFDRATGHAVACPQRSIGIDQDLRHHEQRHAFDTSRRTLDSRQHQMDDVFGKIVLAGGNKNLRSGDFVAAVRLLDGLGAQQTEIGATLRLGEIHGAGPFTGHHLRHEHRLLFGLAVHDQRRGRAHGQAAIHRKRHVRRALEFVDRLAQGDRQALAAIFRRRREAEPTALGHLLEGFLETLWRRHTAVVVPGAALKIAGAIERLQYFFTEFCGLSQNRLPHVGRGVAKPGKIVVAVDLKHVVEQEIHVFQGSFINRHGVLFGARQLV